MSEEEQSLLEKIVKSKVVKAGAAILFLYNLPNPASASNEIYTQLLKQAKTPEEVEFIKYCGEIDKLTEQEYMEHMEIAKKKQEKYREAAKTALKDLELAEQIYREGELIEVPTIFELILNQEILSDIDADIRRDFVKLCERAHRLFEEKASEEPENLEYKKQMTELEEAAIEGLYAKDVEVGRKRYLEIVFPKRSESLLVFEGAKKTVAGDEKKVKLLDECKAGYYSAMEKYFAHPDISELQIKFYLEAARIAPVNFQEAENKKAIADKK
ncbi:MAG: hypothetical protein ABIH68_08115 [bacterium]